ncbi:MAG TPA: hypothetical protein VJC15_04405 [Candidatus Paceibacterota bacterium]
MAKSQRMMTDDQIDNVVDKFRAALCQHRREFLFDAVQRLLCAENLGMECLTPFRARVEAESNLISRLVPVNRKRTGQEALDATGRKQYTDRGVVESMPHGEGEEVEVCFFRIGRYVSDAELEEERKLRGLTESVDPYSLAQVNADDPAFADDHPNATHWKDANGKWCYAAFGRWSGGRSVSVDRRGRGWLGHWWFAGLRK